ncbi:hypothetical protein ACTXJH_00140 [Psychrobacter celer]|nr:hypothetical protein [uncultured Psychrobacter sp.]
MLSHNHTTKKAEVAEQTSAGALLGGWLGSWAICRPCFFGLV